MRIPLVKCGRTYVEHEWTVKIYFQATKAIFVFSFYCLLQTSNPDIPILLLKSLMKRKQKGVHLLQSRIPLLWVDAESQLGSMEAS